MDNWIGWVIQRVWICQHHKHWQSCDRLHNPTLRSNDPLVTTVRTLAPLLMVITHWQAYQVYKQLNSRKLKLTGEILKAIMDFFSKPEFLNQPAKIWAHVHWALQGDGPAYYQNLTPQTCNVACNDPSYMVHHLPCSLLILTTAYQAPNGFLESKFIAPFGKQYLRYAKDSILLPMLNMEHLSKVLYILILTAVQLPFCCLMTIINHYLGRWNMLSWCSWGALLSSPYYSHTRITGDHYRSFSAM